MVDRHVLAASLLINVLGVGLPVVLLQVYDRIIPREAVGTLSLLCLGLLCAAGLDLALRLARGALLGWAGARFEHRLRMAALDHALHCDLRSFERETPGSHLDRMAGIDKLRDHETGEGATAAVDLPFAVVYVAVLAWISLPLAAVPVAIVVIAFGIGALTNDRLERLSAERSQVDARRTSFIIEVLRTLESIKGLGIEGFMQRRYERLMRSAAIVGRGLAVTSNVAYGINGTLMQITTISVAVAGSVLVIRGELTTGALAAGLLLASRVVQPALRVQAHGSRERQAALWRGNLAEFLATPRPEPAIQAPGVVGALALERASYRAADGTAILRDVDLSVRVGETVVIGGANGSGKTTLMWLLAGAVQPDSGRLLVNGLDARRLDPAPLRRQIAFLTQRSALLPGTLVENLTCFDAQGRLEPAIQTACALGIDHFFAERPDGLMAKVGEGGQADLPASIVNAVTIVRGLAGAPRIVLFDEANGTLDAATDRRLLAYLKALKGSAGLVLVTHRPSYRALADRAYRLEDGRLVPEPVAEARPGSAAEAPLGAAGAVA